MSDMVNFGITAKGRNEFEKHLKGEKLNKSQAIQAKCYECMGGYADGKGDCKISNCPLYPWMFYKEGGAVKRELSEEEKKRRAENLKKVRASIAIKGGSLVS